jgi:hypothetical protein
MPLARADTLRGSAISEATANAKKRAMMFSWVAHILPCAVSIMTQSKLSHDLLPIIDGPFNSEVQRRDFWR